MLTAKEINFTIEPDLNLVICRLEQGTRYEDIYQHTLELMSNRHYKPGINGLYDFRLIDCLCGDENVWRSLAEGISSNEVISIPCSVAIIISSYEDQVAKQLLSFIEMTKHSKIDYKLFTLERLRSALHHIKLFNHESLSELGL